LHFLPVITSIDSLRFLFFAMSFIIAFQSNNNTLRISEQSLNCLRVIKDFPFRKLVSLQSSFCSSRLLDITFLFYLSFLFLPHQQFQLFTLKRLQINWNTQKTKTLNFFQQTKT
jgi:hypothetical protein